MQLNLIKFWADWVSLAMRDDSHLINWYLICKKCYLLSQPPSHCFDVSKPGHKILECMLNYWALMPLLSLVLTIFMHDGWLCDDWGRAVVLSEKWEDAVTATTIRFLWCQYPFTFRFFVILKFSAFFSPSICTSAFTLTRTLTVCIRYYQSICVCTWGCIDTHIIDRRIRLWDPEGISAAEGRSSCFLKGPHGP